jgi:hypothetical protein
MAPLSTALRARTHALLSPLALVLGAPSLFAADVLVVDDLPGPGVDFTSIQAAVNAAGPTDVIRVRPGSYSAFAIDGKSVSLMADAGTATASGESEIRNLASHQRVSIRGLDFDSDIGTALVAFSNAGSLWLDACDVTTSGPPIFTINDGVQFSSCASVVLSECEIRSGVGGFFAGGGTGLRAFASTVHLYDCLVVGGTVTEQLPGSPGIGLSNSTLFASGCTVQGGSGGKGATNPSIFVPCTNGATGGPGLQAATTGGGSSLARLLDCELLGGPGGAAGGPTCSAGAPGPDSTTGPGATITDLGLTWPARRYDITSPVFSGSSGKIHLRGTPGELSWAVFSVETSPLYFAPFQGTLALGGAPIYVYAGAIPPSGTLTLNVGITLPAGVEAALAYEQGLFFSLEDGFVLGTPRLGWILAPGL